MPARLHFSNSLDALADRLIANIGADAGSSSEHAGGDPFNTTSIATPASAMRDWLKVRVAEKTGIAVNIAFPHLENLLWDRLAERDAGRIAADHQPARLLDTLSFQGLILSHLRTNAPAALRAYLGLDDAYALTDPAEKARRFIQLSGRLAALFREYEYSRVAEGRRDALAESWMNGRTCFEPFSEHPDVPPLEEWQMAVYRALFQRNEGLRDRWGAATKTYRYTLPQYAEMIVGRDSTATKTADSIPGSAATVYHLFGLSNISPFHRDLIGRLADGERLGAAAARFEIYALNPCAEFWEDAITDRERQARAAKRRARKVPFEVIENARPTPAEIERGALDEPDDENGLLENGLLAAFGKPGRETIKLWCQLTGHDFTEDFRQPMANTLLATVQKSVLSRLGKLPPAGDAGPGEISRVNPSGGDDSLRVFSAPDPRTELEAVRAAMARRLREDETLRPEDLALIPADPDAALPLIRAVFAGGAEAAGNVPVLLPGADSPADSMLLRGFRGLLSPGVLAADRNAVLALLENPAIRRKADMAAERLPAVRRFLEAAGFQEGWGEPDAARSAGASTALAAEERAVLARVLDPDDEAVALSDFWPARGVTGLLERDESARLIDWLARLRVALRPLRPEDASDNLRPWSEWAEILRNILDGFLQAEDDDAADRRAELDLRGFLGEMAGWDLRGDSPERVSAEFVRTLFEDAFRDPGTARAAFLRGGVRVGGLMALRGIPFRHVWVTGLAAGVFPAPGEAAPLDLRGYRRLPGESDPAARDLYALLEVIASTTRSLTLSWVRRDAARDAAVSPSRALTGLKAWIDADVLAQGENPDEVRDEEPGEGEQATGLRFETLRAAPLPLPKGARVVSHATTLTTWEESPPREVLIADWFEVAEFLGNPAVHAAKVHFGLKPYDALDFAEEERAASLFLDERADEAILDPVLRTELANPGTASETFARLWAERARGGLLPAPPYDAVEHDRLREVITGPLTQKAARLRALLSEKNLVFAGSLRAGPQDSKAAEPPMVSIPAFDVQTSDGVPVRLGGLLPWFFRGTGSAAGWAVLVGKGRETPLYVLHLCVSAMDKTERPLILRGQGHVIVHDKDADNPEKAFAIYPLPENPGDRDAKTALRDLVTDLAAGPRFDDLPLNGIEEIREDVETDPFRDWSEAVEDWRREEEEKTFGGPRFWDRIVGTLQVAIPGNADEMIARRAIPFLDWKKAWDPPKKKRGKAGDAEPGDSADGDAVAGDRWPENTGSKPTELRP